MIIAIDFDGTCVTQDFPRIGKDVGAVPILKQIVDNGHKLVLFTMRSDVDNPKSDNPEILNKAGSYLTDAINWFKENNIELWGIQTNPEQSSWTKSPKAYAHLYIDDAALGCPLLFNPMISERPFVDWDKVELMITNLNIIK